jgi:hypothetical protein
VLAAVFLSHARQLGPVSPWYCEGVVPNATGPKKNCSIVTTLQFHKSVIKKNYYLICLLAPIQYKP